MRWERMEENESIRIFCQMGGNTQKLEKMHDPCYQSQILRSEIILWKSRRLSGGVTIYVASTIHQTKT